jgi:hypothetical protein
MGESHDASSTSRGTVWRTMDDALIEAYRRTTFLAETPSGRLRLRIGKRSSELDAFLTAHGATTWAFVTAFNPGSVPLSVEENSARQIELETVAAGQGFVCYRGEGIGDDGVWPPERSVLVLGIDRESAERLGRRFGQVAIVFGELGHEAELVMCGGT